MRIGRARRGGPWLRRAALAGTGAVALGLAGVSLVGTEDEPALRGRAVAATEATTSTAPTTTTTLPAPPAHAPATTALPAVATSTPIEPPADPRAPEPEVVIGSIEIPRISLVAPLNQGISLTTIDRGPSHWPGSALPGQVGNAVVAGHRVTKTRPFRDIDRLVPGDEVVLTGAGVRATYVVNGNEVVTPDAMRIVDPTPTATLTLFACHPPGSARYRYVVTADLVRTDVLLS